MKKALALLICVGVLGGFMSLAQAEPVPEAALDKDFASCMGNEAPQQDPERAEYCNCIRNTMRGWSMESYGQVAMEGAKAKSAAEEPAKLQQLAKVCIAKVFGAATQ